MYSDVGVAKSVTLFVRMRERVLCVVYCASKDLAERIYLFIYHEIFKALHVDVFIFLLKQVFLGLLKRCFQLN